MQTRRAAAIEWPTLAMIAGTYVLWAVATTWLHDIAAPLGIAFTAIAVAQFSSLQHEVLHGHPFRSRRLSEALVFPALTVFVPYGRFRDLHLEHHRDERLTDPYDDPETNYLDPAVWNRLPETMRTLLRFNNTLLGRILVGPAISTVALVRGDLKAALTGDRRVIAAWALHLPGLALVGLWLWATAGMGVGGYLLSAYFAFGLLKIRTFLEHRAHEKARGRSVVIEDRGPLAILFLNNNLHAVHHAKPSVAWYRLPGLYRADRDAYLRRNEGYVFRSYGEVFRRYFLTAKDPVPHPLWTGRTAPAADVFVDSTEPVAVPRREEAEAERVLS